MASVAGTATFQTTGEAYDRFMGRYSRSLAVKLADAAGVVAGQRALDVGCGPGALTAELVARLGPSSVCAIDPSPPFVRACADRHPGVEVRLGRSEAIPFEDQRFEVALAQLVLHFVTEPKVAAQELRRVTRSGGTVAACVWDFAEGMQMLSAFWKAALQVDPEAPTEARTLRFGKAREIAELWAAAGLLEIVETTIQVESSYRDFDELWDGFMAGIGPAGAYCVALPEAQRSQLREALHRGLGAPAGAFTLSAQARCVVGRVP